MIKKWKTKVAAEEEMRIFDKKSFITDFQHPEGKCPGTKTKTLSLYLCLFRTYGKKSKVMPMFLSKRREGDIILKSWGCSFRCKIMEVTSGSGDAGPCFFPFTNSESICRWRAENETLFNAETPKENLLLLLFSHRLINTDTANTSKHH